MAEAADAERFELKGKGAKSKASTWLLTSTLLIFLCEHRSVLRYLRFQHAHTRTAICIPK